MAECPICKRGMAVPTWKYCDPCGKRYVRTKARLKLDRMIDAEFRGKLKRYLRKVERIIRNNKPR